MLQLLKRRRQASLPSVGRRLVYAMGDIHGRFDLLKALLHEIRADVIASRPARKPCLVFLGDYVDRGPQSSEVIDGLLRMEQVKTIEVVCLLGNHEAAMLDFLHDPIEGKAWLGYGGAETLTAYGVAMPTTRGEPLSDAELGEVHDALVSRLPPEHFAFLNRLVPAVEIGDYIFVHAGLRPGLAIGEQNRHDMLWIRNDFLHDKEPFDKVVVHGHTPETEPHLDHRRIGVDTGAYATGVLSAVRLEETEQRIMQTRGPR